MLCRQNVKAKCLLSSILDKACTESENVKNYMRLEQASTLSLVMIMPCGSAKLRCSCSERLLDDNLAKIWSRFTFIRARNPAGEALLAADALQTLQCTECPLEGESQGLLGPGFRTALCLAVKGALFS